MSAHALKHLTQEKVGKLANEYAGYLVERSQDGLDQMRFNQGFIQGLRAALEQQEDAYKELGG